MAPRRLRYAPLQSDDSASQRAADGFGHGLEMQEVSFLRRLVVIWADHQRAVGPGLVEGKAVIGMASRALNDARACSR